MESVVDSVRKKRSRGYFRERRLDYFFDWRANRDPMAVTHVVRSASEAGAHNVLCDEEFRALRRAVSGPNPLRADLQTGLTHFSTRQPDLLRFITLLLLEQEGAADLDGLAATPTLCGIRGLPPTRHRPRRAEEPRPARRPRPVLPGGPRRAGPQRLRRSSGGSTGRVRVRRLALCPAESSAAKANATGSAAGAGMSTTSVPRCSRRRAQCASRRRTMSVARRAAPE